MSRKFSLAILTVALFVEVVRIIENIISKDSVFIPSIVIGITLCMLWVVVYFSDNDDNNLAF